ncbi:hypothetical protein ACOSP7_008795 [Xanthoceras sorbifolium]
MSYRVKKLKSTPIYVKPQLTSSAGTCRVSVMVGIQNDPGKTIDTITLQFQLPPCVLLADLSSNHGTVDILANKAVAWIILGIFSLIRFEADYLLVVGVCLTLSLANIVGFTKCRKDAKKQFQQFATQTIASRFTSGLQSAFSIV